jgi:hypothetical protein
MGSLSIRTGKVFFLFLVFIWWAAVLAFAAGN